MSRTIGIVGGTGAQGSGLAERWARAGERVILGSREKERARKRAEEIGRRAGKPVEGAENREAAAQEIVVITVPFGGHAETLADLKEAWKPGALVVDTTVPLAATVGGKATRTIGVWQGSAAQQTAELVPEGVMVAAAFQNIAADWLGGEGPVDCDVIVCCDEARGRKLAMELAELIPGVRAVDGGKLENARLVEQLTALLITINIRNKVKHAGIRLTGLPLKPPAAD